MKRQVITVVLALILIGFIVAGATNIRHTNEKIKLHEIELKSRETKLQELNIKYDQVLEQKTNTEAEKQEQLKKIQELENERQRLERELQAKLDRNKAEQEKIAVASKRASGVGSVSAATGSHSDWMSAAGIPESQHAAAERLIHRESSWNVNAYNASSGSCSLVQALPCSKIPGNWRDPVTALRWGHGYVTARYGTWQVALNHSIQYNWY